MKNKSDNFPSLAIYLDELKISKKGPWGNWHFDKSTLCLNLLPTDHATKWNHDCPFYQVDLEGINSNSEMLDWIFQLNHKNLDLYGENVVKDLIRALDDILEPQHNCCSCGRNKDFSGGDLAKKYIKEIEAYENK